MASNGSGGSSRSSTSTGSRGSVGVTQVDKSLPLQPYQRSTLSLALDSDDESGSTSSFSPDDNEHSSSGSSFNLYDFGDEHARDFRTSPDDEREMELDGRMRVPGSSRPRGTRASGKQVTGPLSRLHIEIDRGDNVVSPIPSESSSATRASHGSRRSSAASAVSSVSTTGGSDGSARERRGDKESVSESSSVRGSDKSSGTRTRRDDRHEKRQAHHDDSHATSAPSVQKREHQHHQDRPVVAAADGTSSSLAHFVVSLSQRMTRLKQLLHLLTNDPDYDADFDAEDEARIVADIQVTEEQLRRAYQQVPAEQAMQFKLECTIRRRELVLEQAVSSGKLDVQQDADLFGYFVKKQVKLMELLK